MKSRFAGPDDSAGFLLWQTSMRWQRIQRDALKPLGLTHPQFVLLASVAWLEAREPELTQAALAAHVQLDVMMTSQVLRTLEEKGLVRRKPHPRDTRANLVTATAAGQTLVGRAIRVVEDADARFFAPLGARERGFVEALRRLVSGE